MYELYHYNIPGSHWGIRRFQNKDGTLTALGRERYRKSQANASSDNTPQKKKIFGILSKEQRKKTQTDMSSDDTPRKKKVSEMSDKELQDVVNRLRNEQTYAQLTAPKKNPILQAGMKAAIGIIESSGKWLVSRAIENVKESQAKERAKAEDERIRKLIDSRADPTKLSSKDLKLYNERIQNETTAYTRSLIYLAKQNEAEASAEEEARYEAWLKGRSVLNRSGYV